VAAAAAFGVPVYTSSPGDSSIGMNIAHHALMDGSRLVIDHNRDVNEVCAIILAASSDSALNPVIDKAMAANVPVIIDRGAEWYSDMGTAGSKGTKVFALSGMVRADGPCRNPNGNEPSPGGL
jgi:hypothetical protein